MRFDARETKWQPCNWVLLVLEDAVVAKVGMGTHHLAHHRGGDAVLRRLVTGRLLENLPKYCMTNKGERGHRQTEHNHHRNNMRLDPVVGDPGSLSVDMRNWLAATESSRHLAINVRDYCVGIRILLPLV